MRFLTDEHIPTAVAKGLRARGVDVVTAAEAGTLGAADAWLLTHLAAQGRVVITCDVDFLRLHAAGVPHAGIIFVPSVMAVGDIIRHARLIADVLDAGDMRNHVEFLSLS